MSDTRHEWKPWRANTCTAASRIRRRLSTLWRVVATSGPSLRGDLARPAVRLRAAVGQRRQPAADPVLSLEVELGEHVRLAVGRLGEDDAPRVDDHRTPAGAQAGRM